MAGFEKMGIADEVSASAHDMCRHSRSLQAMLDRLCFLLARPPCDRRLELGAIAQPADYRVKPRIAQFITDRSAKRMPIGTSIAGGIPVNLYDALPGIDRRNAALVVSAVAHAAGLPDQETDKQYLNG